MTSHFGDLASRFVRPVLRHAPRTEIVAKLRSHFLSFRKGQRNSAHIFWQTENLAKLQSHFLSLEKSQRNSAHIFCRPENLAKFRSHFLSVRKFWQNYGHIFCRSESDFPTPRKVGKSTATFSKCQKFESVPRSQSQFLNFI